MTDSRIKWDSHHGPAINVKDHGRYDHDLPDDVAEAAFYRIADGFWRDAEEIARQNGYAGVYSEGRSAGWCVPHYPRGFNLRVVTDDLDSDEEEYIEEREKFERFGEEIVGLFEYWRQELQDELTAEQAEADESANLLRQGTPGRGY